MKYKLNKYLGGNINILKILSYNIGWESMEDISANVNGCQNSGNQTNFKCRDNVINFIQNNQDKHIIALQEASGIDNMILNNKFDYICWKPDLENQITYWNNSILQLDNNDNILLGWLYNNDKSNIGRPYTMLFFNNSICIINLHNGHNSKNINFQNFQLEIFKNLIKNRKYNIDKRNIDLETNKYLKIKIKNINDINKLLNNNITPF